MREGEKEKPPLEVQVARLRRQLRRHQIFSLTTTSFLMVLMVITFFRRDFPQLRTGELHIMGEGGTLISLQPSDSGSGTIITRDDQGRPLVELSRTPTAGTLTTFHKDGAALIELGNTPNGGSLTTFNNQEQSLIRLSKTGYGGDMSLFSEEDGQPSVTITTLGQGGAQVLHQKAGNLLK